MDSLEGATKLAIPFEVCRPTSVVFCFCNCSNVRVCVFLWIFSVCVRPPTSKRAVATETKTTTTAKVTTFLVSCQLAALPNKSANKLICHCHCNCLANSQQKYTAQLEQSFHTNTHTQSYHLPFVRVLLTHNIYRPNQFVFNSTSVQLNFVCIDALFDGENVHLHSSCKHKNKSFCSGLIRLALLAIE